MQKIDQIAATVQRNCHIADSRHAGDFGMCVYLLKMREFYRWEKGLPYSEVLERGAVGSWLEERESEWAALEQQSYACVPLQGECHDPFESQQINAALDGQGLVYGAGYGRRGAPHFFLGELLSQHTHDGADVMIASRELARDLTAPPAMSLGNTVLIRRESVRRFVWETLEGWRWARPDNAMGRALACYDFDTNLDAALEVATDEQIQAIIWHELGEVQAGQLLGHDWEDMLLTVLATPAELLARAVRDLYADSLSTLPELIRHGSDAMLHFYFGNFSAMRKEIFPMALQAWQQWSRSGDRQVLSALVPTARKHWAAVATAMPALYRGADEAAVKAIFQQQRTEVIL